MIRQGAVTIGLCALFLLPLQSDAQWITQDIPLEAGWNPVYLEVDPAETDCDAIFTNYPIDSVWTFNKRFTTYEFSVDPDTPFPEPTHWNIWLPPTHTQAFVRTLASVQGGESYLVKVADAASPFTWSVKGRPVVEEIDWIPHHFNFVSFPVHPTSPPTFADFFLHAEEIDGSAGSSETICTIGLDGHERAIRQTGRFDMERGVAYWVKCQDPTDFTAPIKVTPDTGGGLDFSETLIEQDLLIENVSGTNAFDVVIRINSSESPPPGQPEWAGDVPLAYFVHEDGSNVWQWYNFPVGGLTNTLAPGEEWEVRFGVRRDDVVPYVPSGTNGAAYQSILEVFDTDETILWRVPVVADNPPTVTRKSTPSTDTNLLDHYVHEGLWVGEARVGMVSRAPVGGTNQTWDSSVPTNTASEFPLRIILHVDNGGTVHFMQEALLAWVAPSAADESGRFGVWTHQSSVVMTSPSAYRISSSTFPPRGPWAMTGSMSNELGCTITVDYDDPVNPFKHTYHPDHNNMDDNWQAVGEGVESFTISRALTLSFDTNDTERPLWGYDIASGSYKETISGLLLEPVYVEGTFDLQRIVRSGALDEE